MEYSKVASEITRANREIFGGTFKWIAQSKQAIGI